MKIIQLKVSEKCIVIGEGDDAAIITLVEADRGYAKFGVSAPPHVKISNAIELPGSEQNKKE